MNELGSRDSSTVSFARRQPKLLFFTHYLWCFHNLVNNLAWFLYALASYKAKSTGQLLDNDGQDFRFLKLFRSDTFV